MAVAKTRKYKKVSCHRTKTAAKSEATKMRNSGKTARVTKTGSGTYCVYSAGMRKKAKTRRK